MRKLERYDLMDYVQYEEKRAEFRLNSTKIKEPRRIFLGDKLLFIFENTEMVRDHVLETIRIEKLFSEHDLLRQLDIYNPLIADAGEIRCTMIILGHTDWEKPEKIKPWKELSSHIYLVSNEGRKIYAHTPDFPSINQHPGTLRVLSFMCGNEYPVAIGSDYKDYKLEAKLRDSQQKALQEDLTVKENVLRPTLH